MRRGGKPDKAMGPIVKDLMKLKDVSYAILSGVGFGVGDLLVGYKKKNYYFEVKNDEKGKLTPSEVIHHANWKGDIEVVWSTEQILRKIKYGTFRHRHKNNSSKDGLQQVSSSVSETTKPL